MLPDDFRSTRGGDPGKLLFRKAFHPGAGEAEEMDVVVPAASTMGQMGTVPPDAVVVMDPSYEAGLLESIQNPIKRYTVHAFHFAMP